MSIKINKSLSEKLSFKMCELPLGVVVPSITSSSPIVSKSCRSDE
ncbi:hypothetical protein LOK49_Contig52G00005 [Camellia lanceoleosa]|nr:hypothetical protein LOK49_Contig52G00005 [Camellia lanceoleosa]